MDKKRSTIEAQVARHTTSTLATELLSSSFSSLKSTLSISSTV